MGRVGQHFPKETIKPRDVFGLVAGTSTGGLIALMLGNFGMDVKACIDKYGELSEQIFRKRRKRSMVSKGHWKERYYGKTLRDRVRKVAVTERDNASVRMGSIDENAGFPKYALSRLIYCVMVLTKSSTVVTREFGLDKKLKPKPTFICSHECEKGFDCRVCDAARATSAAPTYFELAYFGEPAERYFMDGGFGHNNPSWVIYDHYTSPRIQKLTSTLDTTSLRVINIGTGTDPCRVDDSDDEDDAPVSQTTSEDESLSTPRRLGWWARNQLTNVFNLIRGMKKEVCDAEEAFYRLRVQARNNPKLEIHRFSSRNDVYRIKLDAWRDLPELRNLTQEYLRDPKISGRLERVAKALADDLKARREELAEQRRENEGLGAAAAWGSECDVINHDEEAAEGR